MIRNTVNYYLKFKNTINNLLPAMKAEKRLGHFRYIFLQHRTVPLFRHFIMNLSGKAFKIIYPWPRPLLECRGCGWSLQDLGWDWLNLKAIKVMACPNFKVKKKSSNSSRSVKFEKFKSIFLIFWRNRFKEYFRWQDSITWHHFWVWSCVSLWQFSQQ